MNYKITFTEYQKNIFGVNDFNGDKKRKTMSVLSYLIKYSEDAKVTKSINTLYKMYIKYHSKMSNKHFYNIVSTLEEMKLIRKDNKNIFVIFDDNSNMNNSINENQVQEKVQKKLQTENTAETVENTQVESNLNLCNNKVLNNNYTYTLNTNHDDFVAPVELVYIATNMLKELDIKSKIVKDAVLNKLRRCINIHRNGVNAYIMAVIKEKKTIQEARRINFRNTIKSKANVVASQYNNGEGFNNFVGRNYTDEDYKSIEDALLSWA